MVLNVSNELHFLVLLLLSKQCENLNPCDTSNGIDVLNASDISEQKCDSLRLILNNHEGESTAAFIKAIFATIHNVVYFAVTTLHKQVTILKILDNATLTLLSENKNVQSLAPRLREQLLATYSSRKQRGISESSNNEAYVNVCFISDTDNRENFPNDQSFNAFRKQRDLFYEILRIWEKYHLQSGWNFAESLSGKIKALLSLHSDSVNFMHLARLFKAQLLSTCGKNYNCVRYVTVFVNLILLVQILGRRIN